MNEVKDYNCCPNCKASGSDIEWKDKKSENNVISQKAFCKECGCDFERIYNYNRMNYEIVEDKDWYVLKVDKCRDYTFYGPFSCKKANKELTKKNSLREGNYGIFYSLFSITKDAKINFK